MYLKKRIVSLVTGVALLLAVTGATGIAADAVGFTFTPQAQACNNQGGGGGGC